MTLHLEAARRFHRLTRQKRALERELGDIVAELMRVEETLRSSMLEEGITTLPLDVDGEEMTLYVHRQVWASAPDVQAIDALRKIGGHSLIREAVNAQTLSAFVRERLAEGPMPEDILTALNVHERIQVRARSGGRAESASAAAARNLNESRKR